MGNKNASLNGVPNCLNGVGKSFSGVLISLLVLGIYSCFRFGFVNRFVSRSLKTFLDFL